MSDEKDFINKINYDKRNNIPIFNNSNLSSIKDKIIEKMFYKDRNLDNKSNKEYIMERKAQAVMNADKQVREAVKDLVVALSDLNDKDLALNILGQHILFLSEIFKEFEK